MCVANPNAISGLFLHTGAEKGYAGLVFRFLKLGYGASIATCIPLVFITLREALMPSFLQMLGGRGKVLKVGKAGMGELGGMGGSEQDDGRVKISTAVHDAALNVSLLGVALLAAMTVPNVEFVFGLVGATACSLLIFVLPAAIFLATVPVSLSHSLPLRVSRTAATSTLTSSGGGGGMDVSFSGKTVTPGASAVEPMAVAEFGWITGCGATGARLVMRLICVSGIVIAIVCTRTTILAVREEFEVVQLVQDLWTAEKKAASAAKQYEKVYEARGASL